MGAKRHLLGGLLAALVLGVAGVAQAQDDRAMRKLRHEVQQALLYVNMNIPERAREELERLVESEPGASDALTWLALAKAHYALKELDAAGRALSRAEGLGVEAKLDEAKWARTFHDAFTEMVGGVRIRDAECERVTFAAKLAVPIVNREKRALLEAVPGWREGELERPADGPFFLPTGQYKLGEARVKVIPGEETTVGKQEIGATCTDLPQVAAGPAPGVVGTPPSAGEPEGGGFFADNWWWIALGAVAVAGGTTAAVVATQDSGPERFRLTF